jgi:hypothetical protein
VASEIRKGLSVSKQVKQNLATDRFNLKNLVKIINSLAALDNFDDAPVDISKAWEIITEPIEASTKESLGYYSLKHIMV